MQTTTQAYQSAIKAADRTSLCKIETKQSGTQGEDIAAQTIQVCKVAADVGQNALTPGAVISAQLDITLLVDTYPACDTLLPYMGVFTTMPEYVPLGEFIRPVWTQDTDGVWNCKAYDNMQLFDMECTIYPSGTGGVVLTLGDNSSALASGYTMFDLLSALCGCAGVALEDSTIPNGSFCPGSDITGTTDGKAMLSYIAQLSGSIAMINRTGQLTMAWYSSSAAQTMTPEHYITCNLAKTQIPALDGVVIRTGADDLPLAKIGGNNPFIINANPLAAVMSTESWTDAQRESVAQTILSRVGATAAYFPAELYAICDPAVEIGDVVTFTMTDESTVTFPVSSLLYQYGGGIRCTFAAKGETAVSSGGAITKGMTALRKQANTLTRTLSATRSVLTTITGKAVYISETPPTDPIDGQYWQDISGNEPVYLTWDAAAEDGQGAWVATEPYNLEQSVIEQTSQALKAIFTTPEQVKQAVDDAVDSVSQDGAQKLINTTVQIDADGVKVNKSNSGYASLLDNTGVHLTNNGTLAAEFDASGAIISGNLTVKGEAMLGNLKIMAVEVDGEKRTHIHALR